MRNWYRCALGIAWLLLVSAAARPQWIGDPVNIPRSGRDLLLAIDLSTSMQEYDFPYRGGMVSRIQGTLAVADSFITARQGDCIGLILFGDRAYLQSPLTFDHETVRFFLQEAAIGLAGDGTAVGDAIALGVKKLLEKNTDAERVIILITDGVNTAGSVSPDVAATLARDADVRVYTIAITPSSSYWRFRAKDMENLRDITARTGGQYFFAANADELIQAYAAFDVFEPAASDDSVYRPVVELYVWPLALFSVVLFLVIWQRERV